MRELKIWPEFFAPILSGRKTFLLTRDEGFNVGDRLLLREWHAPANKYTGSQAEATISYILRDPRFLADGAVILSIVLDRRP